MALKDSFVGLNKALRTTLQNVPAVVDTLIRGFDEIGDAAEEESTYSTNEHVVGKWIDGSKIYEKTIDMGALPNATTKTESVSDLNIGLIIGIEGISVSPDFVIPVQFVYFSGDANNCVEIYYSKSNSTITINTKTDRRAFTHTYITIRYTKVATNRAPENDTKNGGDDEPDVKTVEDPEAPAEELKK